MEPKEGISTSEFKLTLSTQIMTFLLMVGILVLLGLKILTIEQAISLAPILAASIVGINVGSGAYSISRGMSKQKQIPT